MRELEFLGIFFIAIGIAKIIIYITKKGKK